MNENESFMTAAEMCEADHPYDFAVANPRVSDETRDEAYTFADLKRDLDLLQYMPERGVDVETIVGLMNEVGAKSTKPDHAKRAGVGVLLTAIIEGLKARVSA